MSDRVMQINEYMEDRNTIAKVIAQQWDRWYQQMRNKRAEWAELDSYIFATDTSSTSNSSLPWKNKTTIPKLTQIRDNLHSNYMAALFPNDKWLTWQAFSSEAAKYEVARMMTGYMDNKTRMSNFRTTVSTLIYDYIDKGNAYAMPVFEKRYSERFGERVADYVGPKAERISPYDIMFDVTASDFKYTPKIVRSIKKIGDLVKAAEKDPTQTFWLEVVENRYKMLDAMSGMKQEDFEKINQFTIDGFGDLQEYYGSEYVEILEFYGDYFNTETGNLETGRMITVCDRSTVVRNIKAPTYAGTTPIFHVGWRLRPDNLIAMGPLDNLVGMQYRLDHEENLKADAMDLVVHPPLKIIGEVEEFVWEPGVPIHIDEQGDVQELNKNLTAFAVAANDMQILEDKMELFAGAPREAMGIRTPGEKTAFEVDSLQTAAGRIFQEKATNFEINLVEPLLNSMLELAHQNFDDQEAIRVLDDETGVEEFINITKEDFTAAGILRPVGARHFAQQAQDLVNLNNLYNGPIGQTVAPHTSGLELTRMIEDIMNLRGYKIFHPNIAIMEQQETQRLAQAAQEDLEVEAEGPTPPAPGDVPLEDMEEEDAAATAALEGGAL